MPFTPQVAAAIAAAGSDIIITASLANPQEVITIVNLWARSTGNVTIRNASIIPPVNVANIATTLRNRVTFEE